MSRRKKNRQEKAPEVLFVSKNCAQAQPQPVQQPIEPAPMRGELVRCEIGNERSTLGRLHVGLN